MREMGRPGSLAEVGGPCRYPFQPLGGPPGHTGLAAAHRALRTAVTQGQFLVPLLLPVSLQWGRSVP